MYKKLFQISFVAFILFITASFAAAHCEVPCGIYDDEMRINMIGEHIATIEKAMSQVSALQAKSPIDYNQVTRWIMTKEQHANELQKAAAAAHGKGIEEKEQSLEMSFFVFFLFSAL